MDIIDLAAIPEAIPLLAEWFRTEWSVYFHDRSPEEVEEMMRMRMNRDRIPLALVALEQGRAIGTVALVDVSIPTHMHLRPWLGGLYVRPEDRHRGVAMALVHAGEERARRIGIDRLYIAVRGGVDEYRKCGWDLLETADANGEMVSVLSIALSGRRDLDADRVYFNDAE